MLLLKKEMLSFFDLKTTLILTKNNKNNSADNEKLWL